MKTIKRTKWEKKLTVKEIKHIRDTTDRGTLGEFKENRKRHLEEIAMGANDPCIECRIIAAKLGL